MKKLFVLFCFFVISAIIARAEEIRIRGNNKDCQFGSVNTWTPVQTGNKADWSEFACRIGHPLTIKSNPLDCTPVIIVKCRRREHTLAIKSNGTLRPWDRNYGGQSGNGTTIKNGSPVQTSCYYKSEVACGDNHKLTLKETISVRISVAPEYTVEGEEPHTIYPGFDDVPSVTLNASGGKSYCWPIDPAGFSSSEQNPVIGDNFIIKLYPNPAKDLLNIEMELQQKQDINIRLVDMPGNEIIPIDCKEADYINRKIDMQSLVPGVYVLEVKFGNETVHRKIIKE